MIMNSLARKALTAAIVAAAGAAGSFAFRHYMERRSGRARRDERLDVSRWEGEGGSPPDLPAAVPHQRVDPQ